MLKGTRDGILKRLQPVSIHGQLSCDVFFTSVEDPDGQIHVAATPTGPDPGLFFSHRAERPCGRFALAARLEPREQR